MPKGCSHPRKSLLRNVRAIVDSEGYMSTGVRLASPNGRPEVFTMIPVDANVNKYERLLVCTDCDKVIKRKFKLQA